MNELVLFTGNRLPTLTDAAGDDARMRFLEFFTANICNPNARRAYAKACEEFLAWCSFAVVPSIAAVAGSFATYTRDAGFAPLGRLLCHLGATHPLNPQR